MRVGIVGLGKIAPTYFEAASRLHDLQIVAGHDVAGLPSWWSEQRYGAAWCDSLEALLSTDVDAVLVATPSATHDGVIEKIWKLVPDMRLLVEKPLAVSRQRADRVFAMDTAERVTVLYHAAYAPEVDWGAARIGNWIDRHGPITDYMSFFSDPYDTSGVTTTDQDNSWLDSGINALSVLRRLQLVDGVRDLSFLAAQFSTAVARVFTDDSVQGVVMTQWSVSAPSKSSTLRFTDGTTAVLDHQATAGRIVTVAGDVEDVFGVSSDVPRLVRHYENLFRREILGTPLFSRDEHLLLHEFSLSPLERLL